MALLTPLPLDDARRIGAAYGLDVERVVGIPAGSVNSNYMLGLRDGGRAFVRIYEEQGATAAAAEARLLDHLAARGVRTPRPLRLAPRAQSGERATPNDAGSPAFLTERAGKPVAVFPWIEGRSLCQARVTPGAARRVGEALASVHLAGTGYAGAPASRFALPDLDARLRSVMARPLPAALRADVERLASVAARAATFPPLDDDGVIHGDLFRDNVLWNDAGEVVALLDFESASRGSFVFDLAVTALAWCYGDRLDPDLARALGAGYASVRPLAPRERERLFDAARLAAIRFSITRVTDFELRPAGSGVYKDYRRFVARLDAVECLGPSGLLDLLGL